MYGSRNLLNAVRNFSCRNVEFIRIDHPYYIHILEFTELHRDSVGFCMGLEFQKYHCCLLTFFIVHVHKDQMRLPLDSLKTLASAQSSLSFLLCVRAYCMSVASIL